MTTVLIATIGSRDVQIAPEHLPEKLRDWKTTPERERATYLLENYADLAPKIELALLRKALTYIEELHGFPDSIVLVVSDQHDPFYRQTDTIITGNIVTRLLIDYWNVSESQIRLWPLQDNPADVDAVMRELEQPLRTLDGTIQPSFAYLESTGGTTAMSEGLLLAGTRVFQARAVALYISRNSEMPHRLAVGKRLLGTPLHNVVLAHLETFQYTAAAQAFALYRPYITDVLPESRIKLIEHIINHAAQRVHLDIQAARVAVRGIDEYERGRYRRQIVRLYDATYHPSRESLLAEVLYVAQVRFQTHTYSDFLTQVVRFIENALRLMCLRQGVEFINWNKDPDPSGAHVNPDWAALHGLDPKRIGSGQNALQNLLRRIAPDDATTATLLDTADRLKNLIRLRNDSTHSFAGISTQAMTNAFGESHTEILPLLESLYQTITTKPLPSNPYTGINEFLYELLEEAH